MTKTLVTFRSPLLALAVGVLALPLSAGCGPADEEDEPLQGAQQAALLSSGNTGSTDPMTALMELQNLVNEEIADDRKAAAESQTGLTLASKSTSTCARCSYVAR